IMADPDWCQGAYLDEGKVPKRGLAWRRMAPPSTYPSGTPLRRTIRPWPETAPHRKFARRLQDGEALTSGFDADFQVESYLRHQGYTFVDRFDANSYLYITRAMDYFDLARAHGGGLGTALKNSSTRFCLMSFTSDWLFPTRESREIVHALNAAAANVSFVAIERDKGPPASLLHA